MYEFQWRKLTKWSLPTLVDQGSTPVNGKIIQKLFIDLVQSLCHTLLPFLNGPNLASFCLYPFFSHDKYSTKFTNDESLDGVFVTRTRDGRIIGAEEST